MIKMTTDITKIEKTIHSVWLDDREPNQLAIEVEKYGHEVEVKRLETGDFEGKTTIGDDKSSRNMC